MNKIDKVNGALISVLYVGTAVWIAMYTTGCGGVIAAPSPLDEGHILLSADERGMRAFGDMVVGVQNEARTPADMKSSHYQLREAAEAERTKRELAPGFLSRLFTK